VLLVTKWLHSLQCQTSGDTILEPKAQALLRRAKAMLEADDDLPDSRSLAAGVARSFAKYYDDVWVWGITVELARMLRQLADTFDALCP
jgi:hypothetical protein